MEIAQALSHSHAHREQICTIITTLGLQPPDISGLAWGDAMGWLLQTLTGGPMPVEWVKRAAEEAGHAWHTVERAKRELGVRSDRVGGLGKEGRWEWALP